MEGFTLVFGLACFLIGAFLSVWFGMNLVASTGMGQFKLGFLTLTGLVAAVVFAWNGVSLILSSWLTLFPV